MTRPNVALGSDARNKFGVFPHIDKFDMPAFNHSSGADGHALVCDGGEGKTHSRLGANWFKPERQSNRVAAEFHRRVGLTLLSLIVK